MFNSTTKLICFVAGCAMIGASTIYSVHESKKIMNTLFGEAFTTPEEELLIARLRAVDTQDIEEEDSKEGS